MDIVRARGQDPETFRELFILAAEIFGVAAGSRLTVSVLTVARSTVGAAGLRRETPTETLWHWSQQAQCLRTIEMSSGPSG